MLGKVGLIPAHAGKTDGKLRTTGMSLAHPRSRGENQEAYDALCKRCGSSPLTRGKRLVVDKDTFKARLIPAHAGKTRSADAAERTVPGSSPLTRGKRRVHDPV